MAFTVHLDPHHVQHPEHGWLTREHLDRYPELVCQMDGGNLRNHGGAPEASHLHHVEVDCSSGLVGYTRLTVDEIGAANVQAKQDAARQRELEADNAARLAVLHARADEDPVFAALLGHLGIKRPT